MSRNAEVEAWYKANASKIKKRLKKYPIQDAEDILQNTALKLITNPGKWEDIVKVRVTDFQIHDYYMTSRGKLKNEFKYIDLAELKDAGEESRILDYIYDKQCIEYIEKFMEDLNENGKLIFKMRFLEEMEYKDIANKLNLSEKSIRVLYFRANKIIVEKFKEIINENT
jgi:RNA polymerase sigma factor (sigma-70 family)